MINELHIRLLYGSWTTIDSSWNNYELYSSFWRLYINKYDGAQLIRPDHPPFPIKKNTIYFIPPWLRILSKPRNTPTLLHPLRHRQPDPANHPKTIPKPHPHPFKRQLRKPDQTHRRPTQPTHHQLHIPLPHQSPPLRLPRRTHPTITPLFPKYPRPNPLHPTPLRPLPPIHPGPPVRQPVKLTPRQTMPHEHQPFRPRLQKKHRTIPRPIRPPPANRAMRSTPHPNRQHHRPDRRINGLRQSLPLFTPLQKNYEYRPRRLPKNHKNITPHENDHANSEISMKIT